MPIDLNPVEPARDTALVGLCDTSAEHGRSRQRGARPPVVVALAICIAALPLPGAWAQTAISSCGEIYNTGHYGPYDYRTEKSGKLGIVDRAHFTPDIEALSGDAGYKLGPNLNYTLKAAPNHHRALAATVRLAERLKTTRVDGMEFSVECFFERGIRFTPNDTVVRGLYAQYLKKAGRNPEALQQLDAASIFAKDNSFSQYNIGLLYFELKEYDKALEQAHRAKALGFERTELEDMLRKAGKWRDPAN